MSCNWGSKTVTELFDGTIDAVADMIREAPEARTIEDIQKVFLEGDRKVFTGIVLIAISILITIFTL